jgi:hypothetical protein
LCAPATIIALAFRKTYRGYTFKSAHEFAWAQFWDGEGLDWEYEPMCFREGHHTYTPDFGLADRTLFIEIKTYGAKQLNRFHLCTKPLLLIFGTPEHCYIRFKPNLADRFILTRFTDWTRAYQKAMS